MSNKKMVVMLLGTVMMMVMMLRICTADPDSLQDLCVADLNSTLKVNGYACKSTKPMASDFYFSGLASPKKTGNATVTPANVLNIPGLNTLGVSLSRVDFVPGGVNPPHTHPRATEIVFVVDGTLDVGFVTTANVPISKTINKGDVFVFPRGLLHYQRNSNNKTATVIAAFDSQYPGTLSIAAAMFLALPDAVLIDAFRTDSTTIKDIKTKFQPNKK